jgi:chemotaxis response regulator CheB
VNTRVVVVDDVADIRWLLRAALDADGRFEVVGEAGDGREGVALAAAS